MIVYKEINIFIYIKCFERIYLGVFEKSINNGKLTFLYSIPCMAIGQTPQEQAGMPKPQNRGNGWRGVLFELVGEFTRRPVSREGAFMAFPAPRTLPGCHAGAQG